MAGRILVAWRSGECACLERELEHARLAAQAPHCTLGKPSTLEMERLEVLTGVIESLGHRRGQHAGAVRLLEHLAEASPREVFLSNPSR